MSAISNIKLNNNFREQNKKKVTISEKFLLIFEEVISVRLFLDATVMEVKFPWSSIYAIQKGIFYCSNRGENNYLRNFV